MQAFDCKFNVSSRCHGAELAPFRPFCKMRSPMKARRFVRRFLLWTGATLLLIFVLGLFLIQNSSFQQWGLRRISNIARAAGIEFSADRLQFDAYHLKAVLDSVRYKGSGLELQADRMEIDLPWNILTAPTKVVTNLELDHLRIRIDSTGPVPEPSGKPTTLPKIRFERFIVRQGSLEYTSSATSIRIPEFAIDLYRSQGSVRIPAPVSLSSDLSLDVPQVQLVLNDNGVQFGPVGWKVVYTSYRGAGTAQGHVQWAPNLTAGMTFYTEPITLDQWRNMQFSGFAGLESGVLKLTGFHAQQGTGSVDASAEISEKTKTMSAMWKAWRLDPAGIPGTSNGNLDLHWKASDLGDASGSAHLMVQTKYGNGTSDVQIQNAKLDAKIRAEAQGAEIDAKVRTGLDRKLQGSFQASYNKFGSITAAGNLDGTLTDPIVRAEMEARDVFYGGIGPVMGSARVVLLRGVASFKNIQARMKQSEIPDADATVDLRSKRIHADVPEMSLHLEDVLPDGKGTFVASGTVNGTLEHPVAQVEGSSSGFDIGGTHVDRATLDAHLENDVMTLNRLEAAQGTGLLEANGTLNVRTRAVQASANIHDLAIRNVREFSATAFANAEVDGTLDSPRANFNGVLNDVVYQSEALGNISLSGTTVKSSAAETATMSVHAGSEKYSASLDSEIELRSPYRFVATLTAEQSRIQHEQYDVVVSGKAEASGQAQPLQLNDIALRNVNLKGNGFTVQANGDLAQGIRADVTAALPQLPVTGVVLTGDAAAHAVIAGSIGDYPDHLLDHLSIDGTVETHNATAKSTKMSEPAAVEAAVDFMRDQYRIRSLRGSLAGGTVDVQGHGTLSGSGEFEFQAMNIQPGALLPDRPISGSIAASGAARFTTPSLDGASATVTVNQLDLTVRDIAVRQAEPIRVSLANDTVTVNSFHVEGSDTNAVVRGTVNLKSGNLNLDVNADTDLQILEAFIPDSSIVGTLRARAAVRGTQSQPMIDGSISLVQGRFEIADPPISLEGFNSEIAMAGTELEIRSAEGTLNGGRFTATGKTGYSSNGLQNSNLKLSARGVQLEYPEGLQSEINSDLSVSAAGAQTEIQGNIDILNALYRDDIDLSQQVFSSLTGGDEASRRGRNRRSSSFADQILLNVTVETPGLVTVSNNVADLDLTGTFRVRGSLSEPIVLGRAAVNEGGEIYFGPGIVRDDPTTSLGRRDSYAINLGTVEFNNAFQTEPTFDFEAQHELNTKGEHYLITLRASGTAANLKTEFTSDPYLSESDIITMLLTGRTFEELQGAQVAVAREQLASYLTGQASEFFATAGTALGLDTVRIDAVSLASDEDISARVTIGKNVTRDFNLTFSQNLKGSREQTWIASYNPYRNFVLRTVNESDKREIRFELQQDLRIGGGPPLPRRTEPKAQPLIGAVTFTGDDAPDSELRRRVTRSGKTFSAYRLNEDVKKLATFYVKQDYLDTRIRGQRIPAGSWMNVDYVIAKGPKILLAYQGADVPMKVQNDIRKEWSSGVGDASSMRAAESRLLKYLRDDGYLKAAVKTREETPGENTLRFVFEIVKGSRFKKPKWEFHGIDPIDIRRSAGDVLAAPDAARRRIEYSLRRNGFLAVTSTEPELVTQGTHAKFVVTVNPGLAYQVDRLQFTGNTFFNASHLQQIVISGPTAVISDDEGARPPDAEKPLKPFPFTSKWIDTARQRVTAEYWQQGFNDLKLTAASNWDRSSSGVDVAFTIDEGMRQMVRRVHIDGYATTDLAYIQRQFEIHAGDPLDYSRINLTRKKLYDTGLFKRVEVTPSPGSEGYDVDVHLNENAPWRFRYGFAVANRLETSDRQLGVASDLTYGNLFGRGIRLGTSVKAQQEERDARVYTSFPEFFGKRVTTTGTLFRTRDRSIPDTTQYFVGLTTQQQWRLHDFYVLSYDYSFQRIHALGPEVSPIDPDVTDFRYHISRLNFSLTRDTRDDILNATRGTFFSGSFEVAPPGLGSTFRYAKFYAQDFRFRQVGKNLVWASGYRLGIARSLGGRDLVPSQQFLAGGGTTLRGFRQDRVTLEPGNGLVIVNQEIRFPIYWKFGGVAFFDVGNIYKDVSNVRPWEFRYSPGFGLRIMTPFVLLRVDLGLNLSTRAGEPPRRIVFGIGQAF